VRTDFFTPEREKNNVRESNDEKGDDSHDSAFCLAHSAFLLVSALVPYKRVDLAIRAANELKKDLVIVGKGPMESELRRLAGPTVRFLGWVHDNQLRDLYRSCSALIFPGEEDFGITPIEAMASGKPVLALRAGGLMETHVEGMTGSFFDQCSVESLMQEWKSFDPTAYDADAIRKHAETFGVERFLSEFAAACQTLISVEQ